MKILIIDLGYGVGTAKSGGSTRLLEVMKRLDPQQFSLHFLTSSGGKTLYNEENLEYPTTVVRSSFLFDVEKNKYQRLISYFISIVNTFINYQKLPKVDAVYSASDYICDIIPALFIKKRMNISFYAFVHHLCKKPQQRQGNKLINLISYLGQRLSFYIIEKKADKVFLYDTPEGKEIGTRFEQQKPDIFYVKNGINYQFLRSFHRECRKWDACFAGGLRETKGIFDLIRIWRDVVDSISDAKLLIMGSGSADTVMTLKKLIAGFGLENNITLFGHASSKELAQNMKDTDIFISTSHEEGWGIAVCEALASGLRCITYRLPAFEQIKQFIVQVPKFDESTMVKVIVENILDSRLGNTRQVKENNLEIFLNNISWDSISLNEEKILTIRPRSNKTAVG